jgi:hypothetical protein
MFDKKCAFGGEFCEASCCGGRFSGWAYHACVVGICILALIRNFILVEFVDAENSFVVFIVIGLGLTIFFVSDLTISCCTLKGTTTDCCGPCNCCCNDCADRPALFVTKLVFDSIYVFSIVVGWISVLVAEHTILRLFRLLMYISLVLFVKIGLDIAAIPVKLGSCARATEMSQEAGGPPAQVVGQVVGQPVMASETKALAKTAE